MKKVTEIHFNQVIFACTDKQCRDKDDKTDISDEDITFILDAYIEAVEARGLATEGGVCPCEGEECRICIGN
jgi:hypothetical protein